MSVSNYLAKSEYGCRYHYDKLKDVIYLVSESHLKHINIDNGEANISGLTETPLKITGFNIEFKEETSLDERYKFQKSLTISVNGYSTFGDFDEKYYAIIATKDNTFYMINVDFPSKVTHTYNLSKDTNRTDFTLSSVSNFPALKLNGFNPDNTTSCKNYVISGINGLKMLESAKTELKESENKVLATESFKTIEYLSDSLTFQEAYDGNKFTTTLEFQIAFDAYKTSWHYNLLEFIMNRYAAIIDIKNSSNKIYTGFKEGLQANYTVDTSNGKDKSDIVTITLIETANKGLSIGNFNIETNSSKHWRYIKQVGNKMAYDCLGDGYAKYLLQEECDYFGNPTGNYKVLSGYAVLFNELNIIGTFDEEVSFYSPDCSKQLYVVEWLFFGNYYCIDGNKYEALQEAISYDEGETWTKTGEAMLGNMVESGSQWCIDNPPTYSWKLTDLYECEG